MKGVFKSKKGVFKSKFVEVFFEEDKKQLIVNWNANTKLLTDSDFKEHVSKYLELVQQYRILSIFVDALDYDHIVTAEVSKWHDDVIVPAYILHGLKKIAFLQPVETFAQLGHQFIFDEEKAKTGLQVQFFDNEEKAKNWLSK